MFFRNNKGIIYALDCSGKDKLISELKETRDFDKLVAYKLGALPLMSIDGGISYVANLVRQYTDLPIIYDHQKLFWASSEDDDVFDIPPIIAQDLNEAKIEAGIVLGIGNDGELSWYKEHLKAFIEAFFEHDIIPIVVAHMTTPKYLRSEGGVTPDDVPEVSFKLAADMGVEYLVIPGNKPKYARHYVEMLSNWVGNPNFLFPGFGKQGGNEEEIFGITENKPTYLIVGPYDEINIKEYYKSLESRLLV